MPVAVARAVATAVDAAEQYGVAFTKREPPVDHEKLDVMTLSVRFDIAKARRLLGFAPVGRVRGGSDAHPAGQWPSLARAGAES